MFNDVNIDDFNRLGFTFSSMQDMIPKVFETYTYTNALNGGAIDMDPRAAKLLRKFERIIKEHLLQKYYRGVEALGYEMWQGVPPNLKYFHNDHYHHKLSHNTNVFIFIDECTHDNMNFLEIRAGLDEFYQVFPNKFDMIWLNQSEQFTYKMIHTSGKNRILNFRYYIDGLNNKTN